MPQLTVTVNLTDAELKGFNLVATLYEETEAESVQSYVKQGIKMWLEGPHLNGVPKAKKLLDVIRKQDEENKKKEKQK